MRPEKLGVQAAPAGRGMVKTPYSGVARGAGGGDTGANPNPQTSTSIEHSSPNRSKCRRKAKRCGESGT